MADAFSGRVDEMIQQAINDGLLNGGPGMVSNWVLVSSWIDSDGDERYALHTPGHALLYQTLGLLDFAQLRYRRGADAYFRDDGDAASGPSD